MINNDLLRSYRQYIKHKKIGHLRLNLLHKVSAVLLFFLLLPTALTYYYYKLINRSKKNKDRKLFVLYFSEFEPMRTIIGELKKIEHNEIVLNPKAAKVIPWILYKDFLQSLKYNPLWTMKNLDFFGALAWKVAQYYGYKSKYNIKYALIFQEYSFYSSYLTYLFESEDGALYNLMHGIPGEEASFFRFSKCFVWSDYFKRLYIKQKTEKNQFVVAGSLYHRYLVQKKEDYQIQFDIVYVLQGKEYSDYEYTKKIIKILESLQIELDIEIGLKPHPRYKDDIQTSLKIINMSPIETIFSSKMIVSQFSTMLFDAKVIGKKVFAFLPEEKKNLIEYLDENEYSFETKEACKKIKRLILLNESKFDISALKLIDFTLDPLKIIEYYFQKEITKEKEEEQCGSNI